jgi:uncharacterized RDD family membrane protein YckC
MTMTPALDYRFAGFWWRFLAFLIDQFILAVAGGIAGAVIGLILAGSGSSDDGIQVFVGILGFIGGWLYYALCESSEWHATPGKRVCGLIVTGDNGERISFGRATGRYFAKFLSSLILMIGFMMAGWTHRKQALHDLICDTLVLKKNDPSLRIEVPKAA